MFPREFWIKKIKQEMTVTGIETIVLGPGDITNTHRLWSTRASHGEC